MIQRDRPRRVALLGVFAILLQALLFGWHHHPLTLPGRSEPPLAAALDPISPSPASAEDGCEICAALHHPSAAPVEFVGLPLPAAVERTTAPPQHVIAPRHHQPARARGPPVIAILV